MKDSSLDYHHSDIMATMFVASPGIFISFYFLFKRFLQKPSIIISPPPIQLEQITVQHDAVISPLIFSHINKNANQVMINVNDGPVNKIEGL